MPRKKLHRRKKNFPFSKLVFFIVLLLVAWWLATSQYPQNIIDRLLPFKILTAFVAGMFYTSYLTTPIAIVAIFVLAGHINPFLLAAIGGIGGTITDFMIVKYYRGIYQTVSQNTNQHFFHSIERGFRALHLDVVALVLGAFIIASPFPDELGLLLIGAGNLSAKKLAIVTYILNTLGILALVYMARLLEGI